MTHFSDNLAIGGAITNTVVGSQGGYGINTRQSVVLDIAPATLNATALVTSQALAAAGALTLTAGTSVTATVINGVTRYVLDVPRCVTITSAGADTGITFTVSGYDVYGAAMTSTVTGASGSAATTLKAFASVTSITASGAVATTVTAGTSKTFGLPIAVATKAYISANNFDSTIGDSGYTLTIADTTSPATALTGDVRGTYLTAGTPDGTKRLVVEILVSAAQLSTGPSSTASTAILGVTQV